MSEPITDWGTLRDGAGTEIRPATEEEWQQSATSTFQIDAETPVPPGVFLSPEGRVVYVQGGPDMTAAG